MVSLLKLLGPAGSLLSFLRFKADRLRLKKLVHKGLMLGRNVYIMENVEFDLVYPFLIEVGDNCRVSRGVRILAHDATTFRDLGVTRIAPVRILAGTFVGERAIILPGVTIGPRALVAAGSVVNRDVGEDIGVAGNPARPYAKFSDVLARYGRQVQRATVFSKEDIEAGRVTSEDLVRILRQQPLAFVRGVPAKDPFYVNADLSEIRLAAIRAFQQASL